MEVLLVKKEIYYGYMKMGMKIKEPLIIQDWDYSPSNSTTPV